MTFLPQLLQHVPCARSLTHSNGNENGSGVLNREEWQAWIEPEGVTCEVPLREPRVGGRYRLTMNLPDGKMLPVAGVYRAIDEPRRLVFTWGREGDEHWKPLPSKLTRH